MSMFNYRDKGYLAFRILQMTFIVAPIVAGLDKFFHYLADWSVYLAPEVAEMTQLHGSTFMYIVGIVEIIVGIGVIFKPKIFAYVISLWLLGIIINLVIAGHYYDIALRDLGLMLAAFSLGLLSQKYEV